MESQKELSITMSDGDKKTEFKTNNFNPEHQLAVIDGLFKFFDIKVNFVEMVHVYNKTGKAYQEFYGEMKKTELTEVNEPKQVVVKNETFAKQYEASLTDKANSDDAIERPIFSNTKIKGGITTYKCHYICPRCKTRTNTYIKPSERHINCRECYTLMPVQTATENGNLEQDRFGNFFIAGEFKRQNIL